jgi:hypothetical protein
VATLRFSCAVAALLAGVAGAVACPTSDVTCVSATPAVPPQYGATGRGGSAVIGEDCAAPCWRTLTIGLHKNVVAIRDAFDSVGKRIGIGETADEIMGRPLFYYAQTPTRLRLYRVTGADLGFRGDGAVPLEDVYYRAHELEYELCPVEVGPMLRLDYLDQPPGEFLRVAHTPVHRYGGHPVTLSVGFDGWTYLLLGESGGLARPVHARSSVFVFCKATLIASQ